MSYSSGSGDYGPAFQDQQIIGIVYLVLSLIFGVVIIRYRC